MPEREQRNVASSADGAAVAGRGPARTRFALAIGLLLGAGLVTIAQAALPMLLAAETKNEDRLSASAGAATQAATACTALVQDHFTGVTVAVDCTRAGKGAAARPPREIES